MEDQQPGTGDLTDSESDEASLAENTAEEITTAEAVEEEPGESAPTEPSAGGSWLGRHKAQVVIAAAAGTFVAAGAFAGGALQPYLADRAVLATKLDIARTAVDAITTLWTYSPEDMDKLPERSAKSRAAQCRSVSRIS